MNEAALAGLLEAIYAMERDDAAWLEGVLAAIRAVAEAILDEKGRFVHVEGQAASKAARNRIRSAAQSTSGIRLKGRKSGHAGLDAWHPLVDARWALVDSFEEDGRRYLVARENQARSAGLDMLTNRERQVVLHAWLGYTNKEIAYALGISDSTVRVLMARAAGRFGASTRAELLSHSSLRSALSATGPKRTGR